MSDGFTPEVEQMEDGSESNIANIARIVFGKPPGPPNSIGLQLDPESLGINPADIKPNELHPTITGILTIFLLNGVKHKWGGHVTLNDLTNVQLGMIQGYMRSVGFDVTLDVNQETNKGSIIFKPFQAFP